MVSLKVPLFFPLLFNIQNGTEVIQEKVGYMVFSQKSILRMAELLQKGLIKEAKFITPNEPIVQEASILENILVQESEIRGELSVFSEELFSKGKKKFTETAEHIIARNRIIFEKDELPLIPLSNILQKDSIGEGGNSKLVYAENKKTHDKYAVKIPKKKPHRGYFKEAFAQSRAAASYTVKIHGFIRQKEYLFLVCEYRKEKVMKELILQNLLSEEKARSFIAYLVIALEDLHRKGIYHLDIATDNIYATKERLPVIGDFGDSVVVRQDTENHIAKIYNIEQCKCCEAARVCMNLTYAMADWIGLGRVTYSLLYGNVKFPLSPMQVAKKILFEKEKEIQMVIPSETNVSAAAIEFIWKTQSADFVLLIQNGGIRKLRWFEGIDWKGYERNMGVNYT